jgi:hypothetical protein
MVTQTPGGSGYVNEATEPLHIAVAIVYQLLMLPDLIATPEIFQGVGGKIANPPPGFHLARLINHL